MTLTWYERPFDALTSRELYELIQLRERVFVVEQDCPYLECDGKDLEALHVYARDDDDNGTLVAYARVLRPGVSYQEAAIGRVVTAPSHRGRKLGRPLMERAMEACERVLGERVIRISAQSHLEAFYRSLGFVPTGKAYLEDGIPHIEMLRVRDAL